MSSKPVYVLGINAYDHDTSACLLRDGEIAYAIGKERITREKHDSGFYQEIVDYCLNAEGITLDQVDLVVRNCYILPVDEMEKRLMHQDAPFFMDEEERAKAAKHPLHLNRSGKVVTISHHLAHAYSAFAASPFEEGAVMVVDGVGSYRSDVMESFPATDNIDPLARESESYYRFQGSQLTALNKIWLQPCRGFLSDEFYNMAGLGALYSRVSSYVFGDWNKCGELMGLAPFGTPDTVAPLMHLHGEELEVPDWDERFNRPWLGEGGQRWEESPNMSHWKDLAWRVQDDTEKVLIARARWLREKTGAKNLCIAGGVGLNCVANGKLVRETGFDHIWIQPAAGDDGIAIGCALYGYLELLKQPRRFVMQHAYLGVEHKESQLTDAMSEWKVRMQTKANKHLDICTETARLLSEGKVFGWFQGRSEYGPRALGNRSILADPRPDWMKDRLNARVKHRQAFRPFAPIVLAERAAEIFEGEEESPFMLLAKRVHPQWQNKIPAIVHVDGTARVQTVREETNPRLYQLLKAFDQLTGVPVLLNTSFNIRGEPIVETPQDAIACFLGTGIDYLALHDWLIEKNALHQVISPMQKAFTEINTIVSRGMSEG